MNDKKIANISDEDDLFNISEAEDTKPFYELKSFVDEFAPEYSPIMEKTLQGENVRLVDIYKFSMCSRK